LENKDHVVAYFLYEVVKRFGRHPIYTDQELNHESAYRIYSRTTHINIHTDNSFPLDQGYVCGGLHGDG